MIELLFSAPPLRVGQATVVNRIRFAAFMHSESPELIQLIELKI